MKLLIHSRKLALAIALAAIWLTCESAPVHTQAIFSQKPPDPPPDIETPDGPIPPDPPPDIETPDGPIPGTSPRPGDSKCPATMPGLLAFSSKKTTKESATFWFYIPYTATEENSFSFIILDDRDNYVQNSKNVSLSGTPGFISLNSPTLEIGKSYRWYFSLYCDRQNPEDRTSVEGIIQRIAYTSTATPQERLDFYLKNNDWYNALLLLAELRKANPNDPKLKADWEQLLRSLNLTDLVNQPIVPCCSLD